MRRVSYPCSFTKLSPRAPIIYQCHIHPDHCTPSSRKMKMFLYVKHFNSPPLCWFWFINFILHLVLCRLVSWCCKPCLFTVINYHNRQEKTGSPHCETSGLLLCLQKWCECGRSHTWLVHLTVRLLGCCCVYRNGVNVEGATHKQVVDLIRSGGDTLILTGPV